MAQPQRDEAKARWWQARGQRSTSSWKPASWNFWLPGRQRPPSAHRMLPVLLVTRIGATSWSLPAGPRGGWLMRARSRSPRAVRWLTPPLPKGPSASAKSGRNIRPGSPAKQSYAFSTTPSGGPRREAAGLGWRYDCSATRPGATRRPGPSPVHPRACQALRRKNRRRRHQPGRPGRLLLRDCRPQRRRQDHHAVHGHGPAAPRLRHGAWSTASTSGRSRWRPRS